jgi:pimeloyl-ACP methyl ester carboxylesterase
MDPALRAEQDRRRRRLLGGLVLGAAAVGIPALINRWIAKTAPPLAEPSWARLDTYRWGRGLVRFRDLGDGPPVVLLHGFGLGRDGEEWREVAGRLASRFRVVVPDLPGWGLSADPRLVMRPEVASAFVRDFLIDVVAEPAVVVAAGHAASAAVRGLLDHGVPPAVGIALVCPHGIGDLRRRTTIADRVLQSVLPLPILGESALNAVTSKAAVARSLIRDVYASPARVDAATIDHAYRAAHRPGAARALGALFSGRLDDEVGDLVERIAVPSLLLWGRASRDPEVANADPWLSRLGAGAGLEVFEHSALVPHLEEAGRVAERLERFADGCFANLGG